MGTAADAVAVESVGSAVDALRLLKDDDGGRAGLIVGGGSTGRRSGWPALPTGARYAVDVVQAPRELTGALEAAFWFVAAAINVIVIHVLANAAYDRHILPELVLTSPTGIAFALLFVLTVSEIVNRIAIIWNYRTA